VLSAAYLHAMRARGRSWCAGSSPLCGGLGTVQALLEPLGPGEEFIDEVLGTIKALWEKKGGPESKNAQILCDAHTIATSQEKQIEQAPVAVFHTEAGGRLGAKILSKESSHEA
jgi:hypothetical protein